MWVRAPVITAELQTGEVGAWGITKYNKIPVALILFLRGEPTGFRHIELRGNSIDRWLCIAD